MSVGIWSEDYTTCSSKSETQLERTAIPRRGLTQGFGGVSSPRTPRSSGGGSSKRTGEPKHFCFELQESVLLLEPQNDQRSTFYRWIRILRLLFIFHALELFLGLARLHQLGYNIGRVEPIRSGPLPTDIYRNPIFSQNRFGRPISEPIVSGVLNWRFMSHIQF